ncbi:MAG: IS66 family insertion sequence element accessory protein TnpB [Lachnospiraceae bacterium]|nr:IS66 family insertion sequence element accessory protein TnpB [Lachnospiraceae bacterium]
MDQVTKVRSYLKREQWKSIITECRNSGMSVSGWCKANGIVEQTYYRNLKRLREEMIDNLPATVEGLEKTEAFRKLGVQTPVVIRIGGATVEIAEGTSQQTIQAVLLALQSVC